MKSTNKLGVSPANSKQEVGKPHLTVEEYPIREEIQKKQLESDWYAIYTKSNFEKKTYNSLQKADFRSFLPLIKEKRVWSDRLKTVMIPLLPSYVFVNCTTVQIPQLYMISGFVRLVSIEGKPCKLKNVEIELMEKVIHSGLQVQITSNCEVGDKVKIIRGPLKGYEGIVERKKGSCRIVFHLETIEESICVEIDMADVERV